MGSSKFNLFLGKNFVIFFGGKRNFCDQVPCIIVDYIFYKKFFVAVWNIVSYNVFESHGGPNLYGVEPWTYYFINGSLNFNIALPLSLLALPVTTNRCCRHGNKVFLGFDFKSVSQEFIILFVFYTFLYLVWMDD